MYRTIPKTRRQELRQLEMFAPLSTAALNRIDRCLCDFTVEAGHQLVRAGSVAREMIIVVAGEAQETIGGHEIGRVGPGQLIGALSCLTGRPPLASVVCTTPVKALVVARRDLSPLLEERLVELAVLRGARDHLRRLLDALGDSVARPVHAVGPGRPRTFSAPTDTALSRIEPGAAASHRPAPVGSRPGVVPVGSG